MHVVGLMYMLNRVECTSPDRLEPLVAFVPEDQKRQDFYTQMSRLFRKSQRYIDSARRTLDVISLNLSLRYEQTILPKMR